MQSAERGRDGESAITDLVDGMALRAMTDARMSGPAGLPAIGRELDGVPTKERRPARYEPWDATKRFSYHLICPSFGSPLSGQCQERRGVWAIFLPSRIGRILCELVLAPPFASTDRAYPLKISHDLRVSLRDFLPVELDLVHAPI